MIALLGGTFDPIHNGHIYIANEVAAAFSTKKIIFIPSREPPHRQPTDASATQRADMVSLAIVHHAHFEMSTAELDRPGPSYTIDTVKTLVKYYPNDEMTLIVGADAYHHFTTWLHFEEILEYCKLIVINRDSHANHTTSDKLIDPKRVYSLNIAPCSISATQVRERIANNDSIDGMVPDKVRDYILKNNLYTAS